MLLPSNSLLQLTADPWEQNQFMSQSFNSFQNPTTELQSALELFINVFTLSWLKSCKIILQNQKIIMYP